MQVKVDQAACGGKDHCPTVCVEAAPEVFALDAEGKAVVRDPHGTDDATLEGVAEACPFDAVILADEETGEPIWPWPAVARRSSGGGESSGSSDHVQTRAAA